VIYQGFTRFFDVRNLSKIESAARTLDSVLKAFGSELLEATQIRPQGHTDLVAPQGHTNYHEPLYAP